MTVIPQLRIWTQMTSPLHKVITRGHVLYGYFTYPNYDTNNDLWIWWENFGCTLESLAKLRVYRYDITEHTNSC
jgi:hypothetical protein